MHFDEHFGEHAKFPHEGEIEKKIVKALRNSLHKKRRAIEGKAGWRIKSKADKTQGRFLWQ